jgi:AcrR family transcriptional regulator
MLSTVTTTTRPRSVRSDGARSRRTILEASARLATVEGLRGLSIGGLAEHIGMSKSGLYAHFGSKEELQLATIDTAREIFDADVVTPAMAADDPLARILALGELFLRHISSGVFPGGCFFLAAAAELDTHPGQVRERIADFQAEWASRMTDLIMQAQAEGAIDPTEDPAQLAFELTSLLALANSTYVMFGDPIALDRARRGVTRRVMRARTRPAPAAGRPRATSGRRGK